MCLEISCLIKAPWRLLSNGEACKHTENNPLPLQASLLSIPCSPYFFVRCLIQSRRINGRMPRILDWSFRFPAYPRRRIATIYVRTCMILLTFACVYIYWYFSSYCIEHVRTAVQFIICIFLLLFISITIISISITFHYYYFYLYYFYFYSIYLLFISITFIIFFKFRFFIKLCLYILLHENV